MTEKIRKIIISTEEKIKQINPKNMELWRRYLVGKNTKLSDTSKKSYESDIMQFFIYILDNYDNRFIFDIDAEEMSDIIEDYIAFCTNFLKNKNKRLARRLSAISSMYIYYKKKRKIKENPLDLIDRPQADHGRYVYKQTYLTKEQVELIRKELEKIGDIQLALFFEFGLSTMLRVNAISNVRIGQIDLENRIVENVIEKEGYEVTAFFSERCKDLIEKWLKYRKENNIDNEYLFITKSKGEWCKADKSIFQLSWIKKIGKLIDEPNLHCHDLRHSGSNLLFQSGMPIETVSSLLNHKGLDVTKRHYLTMNLEKIRQEKDKFEI